MQASDNALLLRSRGACPCITNGGFDNTDRFVQQQQQQQQQQLLLPPLLLWTQGAGPCSK